MLTHGSLFSGIGGFDLAAQWMGWENVFHCEWNEFGQKILKYYWPKAISYEDITKTDFTIHRGEIDILTGGFPCQPYSTAGKRKGKEDERHLWPEMLRAIREIKPRYIVGENVSGLLSWSGGLVFEEVCTDLENEGYEVQPCVLPACAVNAPHRRDRVWFVAYSNGSKQRNNNRENERKAEKIRREKKGYVPTKLCGIGNASNTNNPRTNNKLRDKQERQTINEGQEGKSQFKFRPVGRNVANSKIESSRRQHKQQQEQGKFRGQSSGNEFDQWEEFPTQAPICDGDDGLSSRLDSITFPKWRAESVKGGGNAIVPQLALQIFKALIK